MRHLTVSKLQQESHENETNIRIRPIITRRRPTYNVIKITLLKLIGCVDVSYNQHEPLFRKYDNQFIAASWGRAYYCRCLHTYAIHE